MILRRNYKPFLAGCCLIAIAGVSGAEEKDLANLDRVTGKVLVNKGEGYVPGKDGMVLREGFRVMALEKSSALIRFRDGCDYEVEEDEMLTLRFESPCAAAAMETSGSQPGTVLGSNQGWVPFAAAAGVVAFGLALDTGGDSSGAPRRPLSRE
jgi:hypothetical protein